ncbi:ribose 5-phosphate isomerase B [Acutalibacter intestini]|uniref:ribose 5-phosphate isomerase B n=1 Tax=Acutalibacter intestini TaxID=3093659 RepID=UPI002AC8A3FE|nr:ribose 5-phosphate isomerase B [Acutalibacter sp. M00204]
MKIAIGCDHGGYDLKEAVRGYLEEHKIEYEDFGTFSAQSVDYPLVAVKVANAVAKGKADLGVLTCSTGIGISIAANKVKGIRASVCTNELCAQLTRNDNNSNILCMGGKVVDKENALRILEAYLNAQFEGGRHGRRVEQIEKIERGELIE